MDRDTEYFLLKKTGKLKEKYLSLEPPHGLLSALMNEDYDIATEMLKEDPSLVDRKRADYSETALQWMVRENALEQVEFLLMHGADARSTSDYGETPLEVAAGPQFEEMKKLLLRYLNGS